MALHANSREQWSLLFWLSYPKDLINIDEIMILQAVGNL